MYLSFVKYQNLLDHAHGLGNCHLLHRDMQALFGSERAKDKVLFKAMDDGIIVQSINLPKSNSRTKLKLEDWASIDYSVIQENDVYAFSMRVFPAKKHRSNRYRITNEQEQAQWIYAKGKESGFRILSYSIDSSPEIAYRNGNHFCHFVGVDCEGTLEVTNRQKFLSALENGIGQEKAYGFGLLLLKGKQNAYRG